MVLLKPTVLDGLRAGCGSTDEAGLDLELVLLVWLWPESLDDCDIDGV